MTTSWEGLGNDGRSRPIPSLGLAVLDLREVDAREPALKIGGVPRQFSTIRLAVLVKSVWDGQNALKSALRSDIHSMAVGVSGGFPPTNGGWL